MSAGLDHQDYALEIARGESVQRCQRVRHHVYCEELGYEPPSADDCEADADDARSIHLLAVHRASGAPVGCARIIMPREGLPLPCLSHAQLAPEHAWLTRTRLCELSRLACLKEHRKHAQGRGSMPLAHLLSLASYVVFLHEPLDHFIWLTTPAVADLSRQVHVPAVPSGDPVHFHGSRQLHWGVRLPMGMFPMGQARLMREMHAAFFPGDPLPVQWYQSEAAGA